MQMNANLRAETVTTLNSQPFHFHLPSSIMPQIALVGPICSCGGDNSMNLIRSLWNIKAIPSRREIELQSQTGAQIEQKFK